MPRAIDGSTLAEAAWALTSRVPGPCPCPATALLLSPRQLLEQSPDDDGFVTGLEIDGIDRDLVEVSALVRPLLDVDVRVTGGEGELHGPARGPRPRRLEVENRMRQHTVHGVLLDHGPDARHLAQLGHDARANLAITLHLRLLVFGQEQLEGGDEADDLLLGGLRGPADGLVGARVEGCRADQVAPAREDPGALRPANPSCRRSRSPGRRRRGGSGRGSPGAGPWRRHPRAPARRARGRSGTPPRRIGSPA